jgi:hypothetical protein
MLEWLEPSRFLLALVTPLLVLATPTTAACSIQKEYDQILFFS